MLQKRLIVTLLLFYSLLGCHGSSFFEFSNDAKITNAVNAAFVNHDELASAPIHVETNNGIVTLSGYVKTIRQSDNAEYIARQIPGVNNIQNELVVKK